jgi:hypothetical protein
VVRKALAQSPDARYATAAQLQQELEEAMVHANLVTSTMAVAAYLAEHVGDRAEKRQKAIAIGLQAAEEREKVADIMRAHTDTSGGHSAPGSQPGSHVITASLGPDSSRSKAGETLGSAAMAVPMVDRRRSWALAALAGALLLGLAAIALFATGSARSSAVALPPLPAATEALPSIPPPPPVPSSAVSSTPPPPPVAASTSSAPAPARAPVRRVPAAVAPAKGAAKVPPSTKARVNDGF